MTEGRQTEGRPTERRVEPDSRPEAEESLADEPTILRGSSSAEGTSGRTPPASRPSGVKTRKVYPTPSRTTAGRPTASRTTESQPDSPTARRMGPTTSVRTPSADAPSARTPSAQIAPEGQAAEAGGARVTKVTAASTPSQTEDRAGTGAQAVGSPTALDILAGSGAAVAAEAAARHSSRESPRDSVATEILETEDDTSSEEQEADSVQKTPTGVLCEQIVPLLRYLDRKTSKYASALKPQSYVETIRRRTRSKVARWASRCQVYVDRNTALRQHLAVTQKLYQALQRQKEDAATKSQADAELIRAKIESELQEERRQNQVLAAELARQTRALEESQRACKEDEGLLCNLQSECSDLRAQRAGLETQLAEVESSCRARGELAARVTRCLNGYTHWEVAAQERITLREFELRAAALTEGDSRSRRRVARKLETFLSGARDTMAHLQSEVTTALRRQGLRSRSEDWQGRDSKRSSPARRRRSTGSAECSRVVWFRADAASGR
ncbi:hypothetical protein Mp_8g15400 [Marchantia polymorpha subsp. ruderalis]|nr:hypothetical protein Mp_8g15400 [Marchantia polymorpha subsp. ruderalis]